MKLEERESYKWLKVIWECMRRNEEVLQSLGPDFSVPSFDEFIECKRKENPGFLGEILAYQSIQPHSVKHHLDKTKLIIEIDLDEVYSTDSLKQYVSEIIGDSFWAAKVLKYITPKKRPNMTDFDVILRVGDMKKEGKKNREIAKLIHPRKYADNPESAIRLVAYYNKRYKNLVDKKRFVDCGYP